MLIRITRILNSAIEEISNSKTTNDLEGIRLRYLGSDGKLPEVLSELRNLNGSERKEIGYAINSAKITITREIEKKKNELSEEICESP